jgi:UDP-N-acetylglucosamine--N-acetylmuramyl-(pentapeptide) pyrophosphoryl-undecaprenol N-acetylglucosamine transferase
VPYPYAVDDHQTANARTFVARGAARLVPDAELDGDRLVAELEALLGDPGGRARMQAASAALGRPDAAARVAELVRSLAYQEMKPPRHEEHQEKLRGTT